MGTKKRYAVVGPVYPFRGGISQFTSHLAETLGKKSEILCINFQKQYPSLIFPGQSQYDRSNVFLQVPNERILTPYNPVTFGKTAKRILDFKPDQVFFSYWIPFMAYAYGMISKKIKKRSNNIVIKTIAHNLESHENWAFGDKLTRYAMKYSDSIITLSESVHEIGLKLFPDKDIILGFHPTYSFYNNNRFSKSEAKEKMGLKNKKVILFFGYIKPYKGLDILIKSLPYVLEQIPDAHLLIVGEVYGNSRPYYDLINELDINDHITFRRQFVPNEQVEIFFKASDVLALPYIHATQSGVAQIGFNMGLGAVVTPVGGLPEIITDKETGIVAHSTSPEDFALALKAFFRLGKKNIIETTGKENRKYSWDVFAKLVT